jgi:hypothetical protein
MASARLFFIEILVGMVLISISLEVFVNFNVTWRAVWSENSTLR